MINPEYVSSFLGNFSCRIGWAGTEGRCGSFSGFAGCVGAIALRAAIDSVCQ
jgi:hypothetical protein